MGTHCGRNRIGNIGAQVVERPANDAPEPARRQLALTGGFVNRNDASDLERGGGFFFRIVGAAFFIDIAENFKLRLNNLKFALAILFHFAVESDQLPCLETVAQISAIEPEALKPVASLADRKLKYRHTTRAKKAGVADFSNDCRHLTRTEFGDRARIETVLVAEGQVVEQVVDGVETLGSEDFGETWTNPFDELNGSGRIQHLRGC